MEDAAGSYQTWMQAHDSKLELQCTVIDSSLGPSWGIKHKLERSWAGNWIVNLAVARIGWILFDHCCQHTRTSRASWTQVDIRSNERQFTVLLTCQNIFVFISTSPWDYYTTAVSKWLSHCVWPSTSSIEALAALNLALLILQHLQEFVNQQVHV